MGHANAAIKTHVRITIMKGLYAILHITVVFAKWVDSPVKMANIVKMSNAPV